MRWGTRLSRAALLEEVPASPVSRRSGVKNSWRKLQGHGQKEAVAVLASEWQ